MQTSSDVYVPGQSPYTEAQRSMRATSIALTILATFFVGLRLICRYMRNIQVRLDDYIIIIALAFEYANMGLSLAAIYQGMNVPGDRVPMPQVITILKIMVAWECVYCTGIALVKLSILAFYSSIFDTKGFRTAAWLLAFITISWAIAINLVSIFQCTPVRRAWNMAVPGHCINAKASFIGNAIPNIITDACILILPMRPVWKLHAPLAQRLSVVMIFMLGAFVICASIYRFTTLLHIDFSNASSEPSLWSLIEVAIAIVCACLPTLRPLFVMVFQSFASTISSRRGETTSGPQSRSNWYARSGDNTNRSARFGLASSASHGFPSSVSKSPFQRISEHKDDLPYHRSSELTNTVGDGHSNASGDEVPLNVIKVENKVEWSVARGTN
ncbi:hypothetical protein VTN00DRAFT_2906 [Thermoascus crustaceus]|uniref:uncharacterized protein n=1 Tax=Thermoascus crustaceus TaxID=5088 RepID=UPI003743BAA4